MRVAMLAGISWLQTLANPLFTVLGAGISVRDLILIAGGLFLLFKATAELHTRLEGREGSETGRKNTHAAFWQIPRRAVVVGLTAP